MLKGDTDDAIVYEKLNLNFIGYWLTNGSVNDTLHCFSAILKFIGW